MPWLIGIDEAGYGPNLGPFVMTSVACRVPDRLRDGDLWRPLRTAVRRRGERADGRFLVEDSKRIYSPARGLRDLETGVLAALPFCRPEGAPSLAAFVDGICPTANEELRAEPWYTGATAVPTVTEAEKLRVCANRFAEASRACGVTWGAVRSIVVCPTRFNALLDRWDNKSVVMGLGLVELVRAAHSPGEVGEPVCFFVDKQGGRNIYAPLLQNAFPDGVVIPHEEGADRSVYRVNGANRPVELTFAPRADVAHFCVALASMVSKYLREVLMLEFNAFWQRHVPDLEPTAGYPGDALRFFTAIRPALQRLGIPEAAVWRRK